jgi:hypothetical protein
MGNSTGNGYESEKQKDWIKVVTSSKTNIQFANIIFTPGEAFLERYVARLPKNYRLTSEGISLMEETAEELLYTQSPAGATRAKRCHIYEIAKRYTAVAATYEADPSEYVVLPKKKQKQLC